MDYDPDADDGPEASLCKRVALEELRADARIESELRAAAFRASDAGRQRAQVERMWREVQDRIRGAP